jgi:murein DD-endopeptidase MepM/ murein hydrolase activator NlpD
MIDIRKWLPKTRVSNPVSKLFRPIFEAKKAKAAFGGFLSVASLLMVGVYPLAKQTPVSALEPTSIPVEIVTANSGPSLPLPQMTGVSQVFWSEHPGLDITAPLGSAIYPIRPGMVVEVSVSKFNYGRSVVIDHGDNLISRYAHMGKITVQEGDKVDGITQIGEVGVTGHTTGPHLHLEIRKNGGALNPLAYLR